CWQPEDGFEQVEGTRPRGIFQRGVAVAWCQPGTIMLVNHSDVVDNNNTDQVILLFRTVGAGVVDGRAADRSRQTDAPIHAAPTALGAVAADPRERRLGTRTEDDVIAVILGG